MSVGDWLLLLRVAGWWVFTMWVWASMFVGIVGMFRAEATPVLLVIRAIRAECRPFALPGLLLAYATEAFQEGGLTAWSYAGLGFNLLSWWLWYRSGGGDDDDRWKRRKKKLAEKVAEVRGRLQVVPAGAS
jgi:hypothetical protein